jgi:hypothetical protein
LGNSILFATLHSVFTYFWIWINTSPIVRCCCWWLRRLLWRIPFRANGLHWRLCMYKWNKTIQNSSN